MKFYIREKELKDVELKRIFDEKELQILKDLGEPGDIVICDAPIRWDRRGLHHTGVDVGIWGVYSESGGIDETSELLN